MQSAQFLKLLVFLCLLNIFNIQPAISMASDLTYEDAKEFLESISKVKVQDRELPIRWVKPIYVHLDLKGDTTLERHINEQLDRINKEVSNLKIIITPAKKISNFTIELVKENEFLERVGAFLSKPNDSCISKFSGTEQEFQEVSILIRDDGRRQAEIHCVARIIFSSLGIGDPKENGALLINSILMPYDTNILKLSALDVILLNFAYAKPGHDRNKYIERFYKDSTLYHETWVHREVIKKSLSYLSYANAAEIETKQAINNIIQLNHKVAAYSYLSYLPRLFSFNSLAIDTGSLNLELLKNVKNICRSCYFILLGIKIKKAALDFRNDETYSLSQELVKNYDPQIDTPIIKAKIILSKANLDFKGRKSGEELLEAKNIFKNYYNESDFVIAIRMMLVKWYYSNGKFDAASAEILENKNVFDGSIIHPIQEAEYLLDSVAFFARIGRADRAQNCLDEAYTRLFKFKDLSEQARQELVNLENAKKQYNLH